MPPTCINILMRLHSPYQTNGGLQCAPLCKNQLQELGLSIDSVDALWQSTTHRSDTRTLFYSFIKTAKKDKITPPPAFSLATCLSKYLIQDLHSSNSSRQLLHGNESK